MEEYDKEGKYVPLEEVDGSSEVQGEVTMLNTLQHYQVSVRLCSGNWLIYEELSLWKPQTAVTLATPAHSCAVC